MIEFIKPRRFDFSKSSATSPGHTVFERSGRFVRVRAAIVQGRRITVVLQDVVLGRGGGQTNVSITTYSGGYFQGGLWAAGTKKDEKMHFVSGFRLPGSLTVSFQLQYNTFQADANTYPVQAGLQFS